MLLRTRAYEGSLPDLTFTSYRGGVTVVSTTMTEAQLGQSIRAMSRAIYSPRFSNGKAISTEGVTFTGEWYEEHNPSTSPAPAATPPGTEAPAPAETPASAETPLQTTPATSKNAGT